MNKFTLVLAILAIVLGLVLYKKRTDKFSPYMCSTRTNECLDIGSRESSAWGNAMS